LLSILFSIPFVYSDPLPATMLKIAVTGGIACGKSLVGTYLLEAGLAVRDADDVVHELMQGGNPVCEAVVAEFGEETLAADGTIDRERLGLLVFSDPGKRERLNNLVHPAVKDELERWMLEVGDAGSSKGLAVIVPLLYEAGWEKGWDAVICVLSREGTQRDRLMAVGRSEEDAVRRIAAQTPVAKKAALSDYVIVNEGTQDSLREQTGRILRRMVEK